MAEIMVVSANKKYDRCQNPHILGQNVSSLLGHLHRNVRIWKIAKSGSATKGPGPSGNLTPILSQLRPSRRTWLLVPPKCQKGDQKLIDREIPTLYWQKPGSDL